MMPSIWSPNAGFASGTDEQNEKSPETSGFRGIFAFRTAG